VCSRWLATIVVGFVTTGVVLGSCDVLFQCRVFCFVLHIAFAVPAEHRGSHLKFTCANFYGFVFHHKLTKGPFREQAYLVAGNKQNVFSLMFDTTVCHFLVLQHCVCLRERESSWRVGIVGYVYTLN
jgi:hypothetical protein